MYAEYCECKKKKKMKRKRQGVANAAPSDDKILRTPPPSFLLLQ